MMHLKLPMRLEMIATKRRVHPLAALDLKLPIRLEMIATAED